MWFRRKPKNRAFERRHVLDVKVARREVRRMRVRVATLAAGLSVGTLFAVYVAWRCGDWALNHFVYENPSFNIETLDLDTDGIIAVGELRRWAGVKKNDNLFALDLAKVKRDLELLPAIQSVSVERILPRTVRIRVAEREPVAQVQSFYVDATGYVMSPVPPHQRANPLQGVDHYPIITGAASDDIRAGRHVESPAFRAALRFLAAFEGSVMATAVDIARIDISQPEVLRIVTAQQNEIVFANKDFERQLNRWALVYNHGVQASRQIASLDLSVPDNVPLRWLDGPAVPPSAGKVRKASPYKKKHV